MDLSGDFIGRVVFNEDPTYSGRCKVSVFGVFDDVEPEQIPWFTPDYQNTFSGGGSGYISIPKVGTIVRVYFENQDLYSGKYSSVQNIDPALIDEIKDDYQDTHVILYDSDHELIVLYQPMTGYKISLGGSFVKVDANGSIQLKHRNNVNVVELNDNTINITTVSDGGANSNGVINISAGSTVNITAPTVNVDSNHVNLGSTSPGSRAVKGEALVDVLSQLAEELNTKFPQNASGVVGRNFAKILSSNVRLD